ncbi:MAG: ABC transporter ATP-binding protein [Bacillota bacterium]
MNNYIIEIEKLYRKFGKFTALNGISLNLKKGEILGLLGPNGAGKTTTIKIITGLLPPSEGKVKLLGREIWGRLPIELRKRIGVVFEDSNLYLRLSGRDNLYFFSAVNSVSRKKADSLLEEYSLTDAADKAVKTYSKGMKKRLMICRALLADPELLIMDEPTGGLDPISADIIRQKMQLYRKQGRTVLLSTHYLEEADRICDRVAFINKGELLAVDSPENFKKELSRIKDEEVTLQEVFKEFNK